LTRCTFGGARERSGAGDASPSWGVAQLVPGGHRSELEQRPAAARISIRELRFVLVPGDLEQPLLHAMVEPGATEDELAEPVDEGLAVDEGNALPVANHITAQWAARLDDLTVGRQLDQVGRLVVVELAGFQEPELDGGCDDALLEVFPPEPEAVRQE